MDKSNYERSRKDFNLRDEDIDLKDIWRSITRKKKWFFLTSGLCLFGTLIFTIHARIFNPTFKGSFSLLIMDPLNSNELNNRTYPNNQNSLFQEVVSNSNDYEINTLIALLKSEIFIDPVAKRFNIPAINLKSKITINQNREDNLISEGILNVNLLHNNKKIGKLILEQLSQDYLNAALQQKQRRLIDGLNFLNQQAPEILKKKDELQTKLVSFREKYKLIKPSVESGTIKDQQNQIDNQIIELNAQRNRLKDVRLEIQNGTLTARGFKREMNDGLSISDFDQGLLQQLINVENEIASAKSKYTANSTVVKGLNLRLKQIQPLLLKNQLEAVDTALKLNEGDLNSIKKLKKQLEEKFLLQPALIKKYQNIEQELEIANQNLLSLISARETFQLEMAQNNIPWRIISSPQMVPSPVKPDFKNNLSIGLIGGLIAGAAVALLRDRIDHVFHYPEEVSKDLNYNLLATLPHVDAFRELRKEKKSILGYLNSKINESKLDSKKDSYQRFFFQEAYRNLYTSIRFIDTNQEIKTIVLTSSLPKEGKTLTNILLAKTLSDLGLKVLLIDSDLRRPQIHHRLGLNNLIGFSNLLIDPKIETKKVVKKVEGFDNWSVITGGTLPPDPTRLLGSQRCADILKQLKYSGEYEIILIDSPPVLGLADSLLISEHADGVIILVGLDVVDRDLPKETINKINNIGSNLYGIVTNQSKKETSRFSNAYGYYKYGGYQSHSNPYQPLSTYQNYFDTKDENKEKDKVTNFINKSEKVDKISIIKTKIKKLFFNIKGFSNILSKWLDQ